MRHNAAVALIIAGAALVATPPAQDALRDWNIARIILSKSDVPNLHVTLGEPLSETYRLGCWFTGSICLAVGMVHVLSSLRHPPQGGPGGRPPESGPGGD
jgi:hypothetical protein